MHTNNLKGEQGGVVLTGTDSYTATAQNNYITGFTVIEDTILSALTSPDWPKASGTKLSGASKLINKILVAGSFIPVECSSITLSEGTIIGLFPSEQKDA